MYITTLRSIHRDPTEEITSYSTEQYLAHMYNGVPLPEKSTDNTVRHTEHFYRTVTKVDAELMSNEHLTLASSMAFAVRNEMYFIAESFRHYLIANAVLSDSYEYFKIPKKSGGLREICAPKQPLMDVMHVAQQHLLRMHVLAHDCAYAYVKGRSCKDALIEHQYNESKWFLKLDLKNFFTNCNGTFIKKQLKQLYAFNNVREADLDTFINFCLLNNGLPQGTPLSPIITNLIMVPIDYTINKVLHEEGNFVYTRYADDLLISSKYAFNKATIIKIIKDIFESFEAPFTINDDKTRYASSAGSNWNLGLMLNKDGDITIGYKNNQRLKAMVNNFLRDFTNRTYWSIIDVQEMLGQLSYSHNINPDYTSHIVDRLAKKYNLDFTACYKAILNRTLGTE